MLLDENAIEVFYVSQPQLGLMKTKAISSIFLLFTLVAGIISMSPASFCRSFRRLQLHQYQVLVVQIQVVNLLMKNVTIQVLQQLMLVVL